MLAASEASKGEPLSTAESCFVAGQVPYLLPNQQNQSTRDMKALSE